MESDLPKIVCSKKFKYGEKLHDLMMKFFYQSEKKIEQNFFCLKSPETQSKSKKLKEFNIFFVKSKIFPPDIEKHFFMSQGLDMACLVQRFLAHALNLCSGLLVSSLMGFHPNFQRTEILEGFFLKISACKIFLLSFSSYFIQCPDLKPHTKESNKEWASFHDQSREYPDRSWWLSVYNHFWQIQMRTLFISGHKGVNSYTI